jgi:hypothetical protein
MKIKMKDGKVVELADAEALKIIEAGDAEEVKAEPEVIKVNSSEDITKLLEKVRTEEKKKLYPQVEHFKKQSETLQQTNELLTAKLKELEEGNEKVKKEKMTDSEKIQAQLAELSKQNEMLKVQQTALIEESRRAIEEEKLSAYAARAIASAGGELIPELVFGNSETEIDTAIIASKQRYLEIKQNVQQALKGSRSQAPIPGVQGAPSGSAHEQPTADELTVDAINSMSAADWAKERLNVRGKLDARMKGFFKNQ